MSLDLTSYYNERAKEYDKIYQNPHEQKNLTEAVNLFQKLLHKKTVIEIACGSGYWTEKISKSAISIFATDINRSMIEIAKNRCSFDNVTFELVDMFALNINSTYDALFGGFVWNHIPLQNLENFLHKIKQFLNPNGKIIFIDTKPVNNSSKRITKIDEQGNTYQTRTLENGTTHLVLKNHPTRDFIFQKFSKISADIKYIEMDFYWIVICELKE